MVNAPRSNSGILQTHSDQKHANYFIQHRVATTDPFSVEGILQYNYFICEYIIVRNFDEVSLTFMYMYLY